MKKLVESCANCRFRDAIVGCECQKCIEGHDSGWIQRFQKRQEEYKGSFCIENAEQRDARKTP